MNLNIQYITDAKGSHQAVIIPQKEWKVFEKEYHQWIKKLDVLSEIDNSLRDVRLIQKSKRKGSSLNHKKIYQLTEGYKKNKLVDKNICKEFEYADFENIG